MASPRSAPGITWQQRCWSITKRITPIWHRPDSIQNGFSCLTKQGRRGRSSGTIRVDGSRRLGKCQTLFPTHLPRGAVGLDLGASIRLLTSNDYQSTSALNKTSHKQRLSIFLNNRRLPNSSICPPRDKVCTNELPRKLGSRLLLAASMKQRRRDCAWARCQAYHG